MDDPGPSSPSALYVTSDLAGWRHVSRHADHNGLLVKRPFHGKWDAYQPDIDACTARFDLNKHPSLVARVECQPSDNLAARLEAAAGELLTAAALPFSLSQQIFGDARSIGLAVAANLPCARPLTHSRSGWRSPARTPAVDGIIQDKFVGRALTSYTGVVGTEYTRDENVNFWELDNCGDNDHILRDTSAVETAAVGEILFIKGSAYEGSKPLVHRSPAKKFHADGCILNRLLLKVNVPTRS